MLVSTLRTSNEYKHGAPHPYLFTSEGIGRVRVEILNEHSETELTFTDLNGCVTNILVGQRYLSGRNLLL